MVADPFRVRDGDGRLDDAIQGQRRPPAAAGTFGARPQQSRHAR
jgi:hypothetical protein